MATLMSMLGTEAKDPLYRAMVVACVFVLGGTACASARGTIGAEFTQSSSGRVFVSAVSPGQPAAEAGITHKDELLTLDGQDVRNFSVKELESAIDALAGESVRLTFVRGNKVLRVTLQRRAE